MLQMINDVVDLERLADDVALDVVNKRTYLFGVVGMLISTKFLLGSRLAK